MTVRIFEKKKIREGIKKELSVCTHTNRAVF